jgi:hypothetical protein
MSRGIGHSTRQPTNRPGRQHETGPDAEPRLPGGAEIATRRFEWLPLSDSSHAPRPFRPSDHCPFASGAAVPRIGMPLCLWAIAGVAFADGTVVEDAARAKIGTGWASAGRPALLSSVECISRRRRQLRIESESPPLAAHAIGAAG